MHGERVDSVHTTHCRHEEGESLNGGEPRQARGALRECEEREGGLKWMGYWLLLCVSLLWRAGVRHLSAQLSLISVVGCKLAFLYTRPCLIVTP